MDREQLIALILSHRNSHDLHIIQGNYKFLFAKTDHSQGLFLMWDDSGMGSLDAETYVDLVREANTAGIVPPFHVYAKYEFLQIKGVIFHKINNSTGLDVLLPM